MSETFTRQIQLQRSIERALDNFKKLGRSNLTPAKVRSRLASVKELWRQFQDGHTALLEVIPSATQQTQDYFVERRYELTEERYQCSVDFMSEILEELEPSLPPIRLPPFDGNLDEWEQFRDRFSSLVIQNPDLNNFARMHFLSSCLRGQALNCLGNLPITAANFDIAWQMLISRFENKGRLLLLHLSKLLNLPTVNRESASDLQSLRDHANIAVASLTQLPRSLELWSDIIVHIVVQRLDPVTRKAWRLKTIDQTAPPSFKDLDAFLACRTRALEEISSSPAVKVGVKTDTAQRVSVATASASSDSACPICKARHFFSACQSFVRGSVSQRRELVRKHGRCFNCLSQGHSVRDCKSKYSCRICQTQHHTMFHASSRAETSDSSNSVIVQPSLSADPNVEINSMIASFCKANHTPVLLATARIKVGVHGGRSFVVRALLDQGSEMTFISEHLAQLLRAKRLHLPTSVSAVRCVHAGTYRYAARISLSPRSSDYPSLTTTALILKSLTSYSPKTTKGVASLQHLADVVWADPDPAGSEPVHLIIGAELYSDIMLEGLRKGGAGQPIAQNSIFGWIISGPISSDLSSQPDACERAVSSNRAHTVAVYHSLKRSSLEDDIKRFWEIEEHPSRTFMTPEDSICEKHFLETHSRSETGRYIVRLPFKTCPPIAIGDSRVRAERQLNSLIRRLHAQPAVLREYRAFLKEYEALGHSRRVPRDSRSVSPIVYLPHHPVFRESSVTSHLRVVFNASSVTLNGSSLNDHLLTGPKLQVDLPAVILRWRQFRFVYTADIAKMYRQILVDSRDLNYQRILWKDSVDNSVEEYQLLTVTYGTACAPFLALRVLRQLSHDEGSRFPLAASVLLNHIYVDDVLFGHDDAQVIKDARDQLINLLRLGGFELRKWASNSERLMSDLDAADHGVACSKSLSDSEQVKILGIGWSPKSDMFQINVSLRGETPATKRSILSAIARLYDPLGWVTPVILAANDDNSAALAAQNLVG